MSRKKKKLETRNFLNLNVTISNDYNNFILFNSLQILSVLSAVIGVACARPPAGIAIPVDDDTVPTVRKQ